MITLLLYCFLNGFLFHFDPDIMTDNTKILILIICIASDLNFINTANLIANKVLDLERELKTLKDDSISKEAFEKMKTKAYQYGYRKGYAKAIDDVLKLPEYTFYDTSKEFMNIRIDAISIEDILKLKEKTNEQRKQSKPNRND